ncbi:MAG: ArsR/SmtB family transcription factor [Candidatus Hodarchaeota archaeon]
MSQTSAESDITEVLKSLNHEIRRKIVRILYRNDHPLAYSVFLDKLTLPASSNVAYHLSLLTKAHLVQKDAEGKYSLTQLGQRSALLLDMASESKSSAFSDLYLGFSRLTPIETVLSAWWIFFFVIGMALISNALIISILFFSLAIVSLFLIIYRTKTIWVILFLNNFLWVIFASENRFLLFLIIATNLIGVFLIFPELDPNLVSLPFNLIFGLFCIFLSIFISLIYLYLSFNIDLRSIIENAKKKQDSNN